MNNAYIDAYTCISSETYLYMYKWMKIAFSWRQSEHHRLKKKKKCIYVCNHHCYSHFFKITSTHDINFLETDSKFSVIYVFEFVSKNKFYISTNDKRNWTKPRFSSSFFFLWRKRRKLEAEAKRNFKEENVSIDSDRRSKNNRESFSSWSGTRCHRRWLSDNWHEREGIPWQPSSTYPGWKLLKCSIDRVCDIRSPLVESQPRERRPRPILFFE